MQLRCNRPILAVYASITDTLLRQRCVVAAYRTYPAAGTGSTPFDLYSSAFDFEDWRNIPLFQPHYNRGGDWVVVQCRCFREVSTAAVPLVA